MSFLHFFLKSSFLGYISLCRGLRVHNFIWQESWQVHFGRDYDGKVTPDEVAAAALYLKDTLGQEPVQDLVSNLAKDKGIFLVKTKPRGYAIYKDVYIDDKVKDIPYPQRSLNMIYERQFACFLHIHLFHFCGHMHLFLKRFMQSAYIVHIHVPHFSIFFF